MANRFFLYLLLLTSIDAFTYSHSDHKKFQPSYNSVSQTGLIHLPSAEIQELGTIGVTVGNSSINQFISINATPFRWLEASFYYHRPKNTIYSSNTVGKYLDKGFNLKLYLLEYRNLNLAIGLDDIAGSGFLTKEYVVGTYIKNNLKVTFGVGTGKLSDDNPYTTPIKSFNNRPSSIFNDETNRGGEIDFNSFFKGPIGLFGGVEYTFKKYPNISLKIENNPYDYNRFLAGGRETIKFIEQRIKKKDFNFGISYKFKNNFSLSVSQLKGNGFDIIFSKKFSFNDKRNKVKVSKVKKISRAPNKEISLYQDILRNLEKDDLYLQAADLNSDHLDLVIVNNKYHNPVDVFDHSVAVIKELSSMHDIKISSLSVSNSKAGIIGGSMSADLECFCNTDKVTNKKYSAEINNFKDFDFKTILSFPEFYNRIRPNFVYRYADPTRFFAGGIDLQASTEIKFSAGLYITGNISYQLINSFDRVRDVPDSPFLPHVRTDGVKYLNNRDKLYLNNLQINKTFKLNESHYAQISSGIYEMMFGGYGVEYLWKPFRENYSVGANIFNVKQRSFKQNFEFNDYKVTTGHINFSYFDLWSGILVDLSVGQYLAGDRGYTFDVSRLFKSGFEVGAYFTRTNISKVVFGEGSFDKGFYFKLPLTFNSGSSHESSKIIIQPLNRDGGAKLKTSNPLSLTVFGGSENEYRFYNE